MSSPKQPSKKNETWFSPKTAIAKANDGCIHLSRTRLPTETHKIHTGSHRFGQRGGHALKVTGVAVCMRSSRRGYARAHTRIHSQICSFRDRETQAHWTVIVSRDSGGSGVLHPPPPFVAPSPCRTSRGSSLFHSDVLSFTRHPRLFFSLAFRIRPFSPISPSNRLSSPSVSRPLIPNVRTPAYMSLLLTTTLYYWYSRTTTSSGVSTTFRPDLRPANNREISCEEFSAEKPRRRDLCTLFPSSFLAKLALQCAPTLKLLRIYFIYQLPNLSPFTRILSNCQILLFKLRMIVKEHTFVSNCANFFL